MTVETTHYALPSGQYYGAWVGNPETDANPFEGLEFIQVPGAPESTAWFWDQSVSDWYLPEVTQVPEKVTMRQARLALHAAGLLASVEAAIEALPEPNRVVARIEWDYASEVHRASEFVTLLGAALELDKQSLDDLFLKAREL